MNDLIISTTGTPRGCGSDRFRYVAFLTKEEKETALSGGTVLVRCPWSDHHMATEYKKVVPYRTNDGRQRFGHKNYGRNS